MMSYTRDIQTVVNDALSELKDRHDNGKVPNSPVSNNHFLVRWITTAIKKQTYSTIVAKNLIQWQKQGRSKGTSAGVETQFKRISAFYAQMLNDENNAITDARIERFLDAMEEADWEVSTSEPLLRGGKVQIFTDGQDSLALCADQCDDCFEGENLTKKMSFFVRGNHQKFIDIVSEHGFLVHKVTDYKSNVKYHGEYWIFPQNEGDRIAEIPMNFQA
ncbi:DUF2913 family protein [Vibrio sp.]|nr:DUF2913 family protein [Vibrio sp.]